VTYIGSVRDAHMMQESIQGFCPEGVEDFAAPQHVIEASRWQSGQALGVAIPKLPYLAVPRERPMPVPSVRDFAAHQAEQRIAALEAELAAARGALAAAADQARELTGQATKAAQRPLERALAAWPGSGHTNQLTGKAAWW
jgi:hypothetical protein